MAYSSAQIIEFDCVLGEGRIAVTSSGIDVSDDTIDDVATIYCPLPLKIYGFGLYVTETLGTAVDEDMLLQVSALVAGTDKVLATMDLDALALQSGDGLVSSITASTGSEAILAGDVIWAPASSFPAVVIPGQIITVLATDNGALGGELLPFVFAEWLNMDFRPTNMWVNQS